MRAWALLFSFSFINLILFASWAIAVAGVTNAEKNYGAGTSVTIVVQDEGDGDGDGEARRLRPDLSSLRLSLITTSSGNGRPEARAYDGNHSLPAAWRPALGEDGKSLRGVYAFAGTYVAEMYSHGLTSGLVPPEERVLGILPNVTRDDDLQYLGPLEYLGPGEYTLLNPDADAVSGFLAMLDQSGLVASGPDTIGRGAKALNDPLVQFSLAFVALAGLLAAMSRHLYGLSRLEEARLRVGVGATWPRYSWEEVRSIAGYALVGIILGVATAAFIGTRFNTLDVGAGTAAGASIGAGLGALALVEFIQFVFALIDYRRALGALNE